MESLPIIAHELFMRTSEGPIQPFEEDESDCNVAGHVSFSVWRLLANLTVVALLEQGFWF